MQDRQTRLPDPSPEWIYPEFDPAADLVARVVAGQARPTDAQLREYELAVAGLPPSPGQALAFFLLTELRAERRRNQGRS